jgi:hypothetical protein
MAANGAGALMARPAILDTPLLDRLRRHPGGVAALSADSGVPIPTLYALCAGRHRRPPYRVLERLALVLGVELDGPGGLVDLWARANATAKAGA